MNRSSRLLFASFLTLSAASFLAGGCSSCGEKTSGTGATKEDVAIMPRETNFAVMVNFARMRDTPLWKKAVELRDGTPESKQKYDDFVKRTGLDPIKQLDSAFIGLPTTPNSGEFGAVLRGGPFDENKLVAYFKEEAAKSSSDVTSVDYNGKKLYSDKQGQAFAAFLDAKTVIFGGKEWSKKMLDLLKAGSTGDNATKNDVLMALIKKTKTADAFWGAGIVPEEARTKLKEDPKLSSAATMKDVYASIDLAGGFTFTGAVDLAGEADAKDLTAKMNEQLVEAKKNPQIQMMGMAQFLDGIKVSQQAAAFHLDIKLTQPQVDDLIARIQGLLKTFGGALGGGGGGGGDIPAPPPAGNP